MSRPLLLVAIPILAGVSCAEVPAPEPSTPAAAKSAAPSTSGTFTPVSIAPSADPPPAPVAVKLDLPSACAPDSPAKLCVPEPSFVQRLCASAYPDVALVMFHKKSPWSRGYVTRAIDAWNTASSLQSSSRLAIDEEVILVKQRSNPGGIVVSGASGGYEALRWDGTCVSLGGDEVSRHPRGLPKHAAIPWRRLDDRTQHALLDDPRVKESYEQRRKECQGTGTAAQCDRAEAAMSRSIVFFVRAGGQVPTPASVP